MYSPIIVAQRQADLESRLSFPLVRHSIDEIDSWVEHLAKRRQRIADKLGLKPEEVTLRHLNEEERKFVRNELLLSSIDFDYWSRRYCYILFDAALGGGLHRFVPWGPQLILGKHIADLEQEQTDAYSRGESVNGILIANHKARQLGATAYCRALLIHRLVTSSHILAVTASVDDAKVLALQERDNRIIENMPWWMQPNKGYGEKGLHLFFDKLDTKLQYQTLVQQTGIAQGEQYTLGHITEVASDPYEGFRLNKDYFPAIPRAPWVLHIMETTAQGRDNFWRFFVEETRKGQSRWKLVFIPWYAEPKKYRMTPPLNWEPSQDSMRVAERVWNTSEEFFGKKVLLSKENLYWWEFNKAEAVRKGNLNLFLTNYCSTIEESFQHTSTSVFDSALLDHFRLGVVDGTPLEVGIAQ
jgi:hypothetical protein